jgi:hypothetical protein
VEQQENVVCGLCANKRFYIASIIFFFFLMIPLRAFGQSTVASATDTTNAANSVTISATLPDAPRPAPKSVPPAAPPKPQAANNPPPSAFPASVVNKQFPRWLRFSGEYRFRPEEHTAYGFAPRANDGFVLSRLRLNMEFLPTSWFSTFVQAQDSEAGGIQPAHVTTSIKDAFDLRQAYLQSAAVRTPGFVFASADRSSATDRSASLA